MKQTVLLDIDGVIANFRKLYVDCCNEANKTQYTVKDTGSEWFFARSMRLSREQQRKTWKAIDDPGRAKQIEPLPGAVAGVYELLRVANVYFVSAPVPTSPTWTYDRANWLSDVLGINAREHLVFTSQKHLVQGNILVDDKPEAVLEWLRANPELEMGVPRRGIIWGDTVEDVAATYRTLHATSDVYARTTQDNSWTRLLARVVTATSA